MMVTPQEHCNSIDVRQSSFCSSMSKRIYVHVAEEVAFHFFDRDFFTGANYKWDVGSRR